MSAVFCFYVQDSCERFIYSIIILKRDARFFPLIVLYFYFLSVFSTSYLLVLIRWGTTQYRYQCLLIFRELNFDIFSCKIMDNLPCATKFEVPDTGDFQYEPG